MIVKVYWNLHKDMYSVQYKGKVVAHLPFLCMKDCEFKVSEAGRKRVLRERRKNVHAYVVGTLLGFDPNLMVYKRVRYNPYEAGYFQLKDTGEPVYNAPFVLLCQEQGHPKICI